MESRRMNALADTQMNKRIYSEGRALQTIVDCKIWLAVSYRGFIQVPIETRLLAYLSSARRCGRFLILWPDVAVEEEAIDLGYILFDTPFKPQILLKRALWSFPPALASHRVSKFRILQKLVLSRINFFEGVIVFQYLVVFLVCPLQKLSFLERIDFRLMTWSIWVELKEILISKQTDASFNATSVYISKLKSRIVNFLK